MRPKYVGESATPRRVPCGPGSSIVPRLFPDTLEIVLAAKKVFNGGLELHFPHTTWKYHFGPKSRYAASKERRSEPNPGFSEISLYLSSGSAALRGLWGGVTPVFKQVNTFIKTC